MKYRDFLVWLDGVKRANPDRKELLKLIEKTNLFLKNATAVQAYNHVARLVQDIAIHHDVVANNMSVEFRLNNPGGRSGRSVGNIWIEEFDPDNTAKRQEFIKSFNLDENIVFDLLKLSKDYLPHLRKDIESMKEEDRNFCEGYLTSLNVPANTETELDPLLQLTIRKHQVVSTFVGILEDENTDLKTRISLFKTCLKDHRETLEKRRDSLGITFLKGIFTVLSLGTLLLSNLWNPQGKELVDNLEKTTSPKLN